VVYVADIPAPYNVELLRELAQNIDVTAFFCAETATRGMPWCFDEQLGFKHLVLGGPVIRRRGDAIDYYVSPTIFRRLIQIRPHIVISGMFSFPSFYSWLYTQFYRAKLILYSDGTAESESSLSWHQLAARKFLLGRVSSCIAQSGPAAQRLRQLAPGASVLLAPHTTNLSPLLGIAMTRDWSERDELRLLSVGRLTNRKGVDHLIRALAKMRSTRRPVRLTIVGSGPEECDLRALVSNLKLARVQFAGFVDQAGLPSYYGNADAFVFPTLGDTYGLVLLEAAAAGLALVASCHAGATKDLVGNSQAGMVFDPSEEDILANQIAALADNHDLVIQMGRAASKVAQEQTPARIAEIYLQAINLAKHEFSN